MDDPTLPHGFKALAFLAPGAPDRARNMALEVVARLPEGARALLEVPLVYFEMLRERRQYGRVKIERERRVAFLVVNASASTAFGEVPFPAKSRMAMRLLVEIPEQYRERTFQVYARQLFEREEVGRVTWQLAPRREGN